MTFAFLIVGILLLVSAVRNTQSQLFTLVKGDLTGSDNFLYWIVAILVIGALGYVKELKGFSTAFLVLIAVGIVLSNKGFFASFQQQLSGASGQATNVGSGNTATNLAIGF